MKKHFVVILLAMIVLFPGAHGFAQEKTAPEKETMAGKTEEGQPINAFMVEKILGSAVINANGERLGKIGNLIIDVDSGTIVYAVLESGGLFGIDKFYPVPWKSLVAVPSEGVFFLNQSKEQMEKAPSFDKRGLSNLRYWHWGKDVFNHYGIPGYPLPDTSVFAYPYSYIYYFNPLHLGASKEDPYQKFFDAKTIRTISGEVIRVDHIPEPAADMEMRITVFVDKKEILPVYLGPAFYIERAGPAKHLKPGDKVTVTGSQITVRGDLFIIAQTVKRGDEVLELRGKDGTPEWVGWKKTTD
jgi:sporulation protein YlmC with PRC-barrel domain